MAEYTPGSEVHNGTQVSLIKFDQGRDETKPLQNSHYIASLYPEARLTQ